MKQYALTVVQLHWIYKKKISVQKRIIFCMQTENAIVKNKRNNITHINDTLNNTEKEKLPPELK